MYCLHCGALIDDSDVFCPKCGESTWPEETPPVAFSGKEPKKIPETPEHRENTVHMKCKSCGGTLVANPERSVLNCPYCGEKELVIESDAVAIERIRNKTKREIELEKLRQQDERLKHNRRLEEAEKYKNSKQYKFTIVSLVICIITSLGTMTDLTGIPCTIIGLAQCACLVLSILYGKQVLSSEKAHRETLYMYIAIGLVFPFMLFLNLF